MDLHDLPRVDLICLSHYHADHFDQDVEASLRRDMPIITTSHAKHHLSDGKSADERFTAVHALEPFDSAMVRIKRSFDGQVQGQAQAKKAAIKISAMPGKHVPPGVLGSVNDLLKAARSLITVASTVLAETRAGPTHERVDDGTWLQWR